MNDERTLICLIGGLVFFSAMVLASAWLFPADKELRPYFAGIASGFSGSLFTWLQKK